MARAFSAKCYHRTALGMMFSEIQGENSLTNYIFGVDMEEKHFSLSGSTHFEYGKIDSFFKATEKLNHITLEFHSFEETVEETTIEKLFYGNIKVKYPSHLQFSVEPYLKFLEPENVISKSVLPIVHATIDDFQLMMEGGSLVNDPNKLYGLETGFVFKIMGAKTVKQIIYGTKRGELVYMCVPKDGVDNYKFLKELNEIVFIPGTLYQFIDRVIIPA